MAWVVLVIAGVLESVWVTALGKPDGFSRPGNYAGGGLSSCVSEAGTSMAAHTFDHLLNGIEGLEEMILIGIGPPLDPTLHHLGLALDDREGSLQIVKGSFIHRCSRA